MRLNYVVSSMIFWGRETHLSLEQECQFLKSTGFGIELLPNLKRHYDCRYDKKNWPRLVQATAGMIVVMKGRTDNPSMDEWLEQIHCARLLRANIVVELEGLTGCDDKFITEILNNADENNVKISVETGCINMVQSLLDKYSNLNCCFDTGFVNTHREIGFNEAVDRLADKIIQVHLTDNYGDNNDFMPPGLAGGIGREQWLYLKDVLTKKDRDIVASLKMAPTMPAVMMKQACGFLFDELGWPQKPQMSQHQTKFTYN